MFLKPLSSNPFLVFSVLNSIILCIVVSLMGVIKKQCSSSELDNNNVLPFNTFLFDGVGETQQDDDDYLEDTTDDEVNECDNGNCDSVSCSEDESDDENKEIAAQEREESDENLKMRIENFIAKVYKGWSDESCLDRDIL